MNARRSIRSRWCGTAVLIAVAALFVCGTASAATQTIDGDPVDVTVCDGGRIVPYYDNWANKYQYFSATACNNVLWLNGTSMGFDAPGGSNCGAPLFTAISNSKPDLWTIETVYDSGGTGVRITQRIEYVNGTRYYTMKWSIANNGASTYTDLRFIHGGDTFFGGQDSANGNYDSGLNMVYLTNEGVTGIMGLLGTPTSPMDHYQAGHFSTTTSQMCAGRLSDTVDPSFTDAGYAAEWDRATLAPGDVWEIVAIEKWTAAGDVQVFAPVGQNGYVGDTFNYNFTVQNLQGSQDTFDLSTSSSQGWTVSLPNGSTVTIGASSSETVPVRVTATSAGTDVTTLTVTSQSDANVTNSDSVTTQANVPPPLQRINVTPTSQMLNITESANFTVAGFDHNNDSMDDLVFAWYTTPSGVGTLNATTGSVVNFTALHAGRNEIYAVNGSVSSSETYRVWITVNAPPETGSVANGTGNATSGNSTAIVMLNNGSVNGTITIEEIGDPLNGTEDLGNRAGLGTGSEPVKGVNVTVNGSIEVALNAMGGHVHIRVEYNGSQLGNIDENTLYIYKFINGTGWVKLVAGNPAYCIANGRNTTADYVWVNVTNCSIFLLAGTPTATPTPSGGDREGTYPPGWFETPTPTVTATKAPAATTTATDAPPGDKVTPTPTKAKPAAAKATAPAAEGTTAGDAKKDAPGFTAVFVIAGILAVAYAMMRRRE